MQLLKLGGDELLLAGDVGGTKVLLQLVEQRAGSAVKLVAERRYLCAEFDSLESILNNFLSDFKVTKHIEQACFGLPGPVNSRKVQLTNLPWIVDADQIEQACSIKRVELINDFYAAANGIEMLQAQDLHVLHAAGSTDISEATVSSGSLDLKGGHRLVVGAGTGLGMAPIYFDGQRYIPLASEGGHFEFAPISMTQQFLLQWLWRQWEHVSYERVLSGPGLETLYSFFELTDCTTTFVSDANLVESQVLVKANLNFAESINMGVMIEEQQNHLPQKQYTAEQVYQAAEQGEPAAVKALIEFVTIYGAYVGAAALIWNAPGGIYLAGGIAKKMVNWMAKPYFLKAFLEKGRMAALVKTMPIYLVTDEALGLKGAMHFNQQNYKKDSRSNTVE